MNAHYDSYEYQNYWQDREYEHLSEKIVLENIFSHLPFRSNCLDIGAGFGRLVPIYAPYCNQITLLDPSSKNLKDAKIFLRSRRNITKFVKATADKLPFADNSFDTLVMVRVMHHILTPEISFQEMSRVLTPGGYLILEFANKLHLKNKLKLLLTGQLDEIFDIRPQERRSPENIRQQSIDFVNHHPQAIYRLLRKNRLLPQRTFSVSNFRSAFFKTHIPLSSLLSWEKMFQNISSRINILPGPSIFVLAKKAPQSHC